MAGIDVQHATADTVGGVAPYFGLLGGEVGDVSLVLRVPGVSEQRHTGDLGLEVFGKTLLEADDVVHDSGALRVATGDDGLAASCLLEGLRALCDACRVCPVHADVGHDGGGVSNGEGLHSGELGPQRALERWPNDETLRWTVSTGASEWL